MNECRLSRCAAWSCRKSSRAAAVFVSGGHVEAEEDTALACGLPNKLPHAVILVTQQLLGAGAGRLGRPVVP